MTRKIEDSESVYQKKIVGPQLNFHKTIRGILTPGKLDSYAGIVPLKFLEGVPKGGQVYISYSVEGVGTKTLVAQFAKKFDTIGIDLVAMNVNDIICSGSRPFAFADYLALGQNFPTQHLDALCRGIRKGTDEAGIQTVSGETAIVPEMLQGVEPNLSLDIVGSSIGFITNEPITGTRIEPDDVVVGFSSSGLHSNGYTLARTTLLRYFRQGDSPCADLELKDVLPETGRTIEDELLTPTKIYVKEINEAVETLDVHGLAHITGQGFKKLLRLCYSSGCGLLIDDLPAVPPIMKSIQNVSGFSEQEMYNTFNMGVGFVVVLPKEQADDLISICEKNKTSAKVIGKVPCTREDAVHVKTKVGAFEFQGKLE